MENSSSCISSSIRVITLRIDDSEKINVNDLAYIVILIGGHMRNTDLCLLASNSVLQSKS